MMKVGNYRPIDIELMVAKLFIPMQVISCFSCVVVVDNVCIATVPARGARLLGRRFPSIICS